MVGRVIEVVGGIDDVCTVLRGAWRLSVRAVERVLG